MGPEGRKNKQEGVEEREKNGKREQGRKRRTHLGPEARQLPTRQKKQRKEDIQKERKVKVPVQNTDEKKQVKLEELARKEPMLRVSIKNL